MQTVSDEKLLMLFYGELAEPEAAALRQRMAEDEALTKRFAELSGFLEELPDSAPEKDANYGRRVWARVEMRLDLQPAKSRGWFRPWRLAGGALVLGMVAVTAFQLGRISEAVDPSTQYVAGDGAEARVFNAGLQTHMESAARLFATVANTDAGISVDVESEKEWASVLLVANRLYRYAAEQNGQHRVAAVLRDMEPVLIQLANSDRNLTDAEFDALRQRIASQDLLFKARASSQTAPGKRTTTL